MSITDNPILDALYQALPDPVMVSDGSGSILFVNRAAAELVGQASECLVGRPLNLLIARDEPGEGGETISTYRHADGTMSSATTRTISVPAGDRGAVMFVHILGLPAARASKDRTGRAIDIALEAISEGIAVYDRDERLVLCNTAYRRLFGPAGERFRVGASVAELAADLVAAEGMAPGPVGSPQAEAWIRQQVDLFRRADGEARVFSYGNGRWLRVENTAMPDGRTVAIRVDVTELKEIELALERQRLDYSTLVESIPDFITRIAPDLTYTFVNAHFAEFIGRPQPDFIGRSVLDFIPEGDPLRDMLIALTPAARDVTREQRRVLDTGEDIWILWTNIAVFDAGRLIEYVTVGRDVTEIKRQQLRIADQSAELQRKNAALGQFTSTVSHDLKAPMRHISLFAEMIADDVAAGKLEEVASYAQQLRRSSRRMLQLVDSLLDYSRIADRIASHHRVRVREVVDDALLNLQSDIADSGASISIGVLPDVMGDAELLKRLFQNVIGNALKYRRPGVAPAVSIEGELEGHTARFFCTDNGIGIEPHYAEKIFDIFQRLHRDEAVYPGTGVGLSLAKRIADSHKGMIALDPTYTAGARFIITMPAA